MIDVTIKLPELDRIADALERLALIESAARFTFTLNLNLGGPMPTYKSDRPDFDAAVLITAADSEGNIIENSPIPQGFTLMVESDNPDAITATQDADDPRIVHYHVVGPQPDGSPSQANVKADLFDAAHNLVATGSSLVTVTVGDPAAITAINMNLPTS